MLSVESEESVVAGCCGGDGVRGEERYTRAMDALQGSTLRVTAPRRAMLRVLSEDHGPFTTEEIHGRLPEGTCDLVTVYRSLAAMEREGIVRRCDFGDGSLRFEMGGGPHHHHLICRHCHRVEVIEGDCAVLPLEEKARERGFSDVAHSLEIFGVCPGCKGGAPDGD